jgi:DNA-binding NarL/FixJ family response regulator
MPVDPAKPILVVHPNTSRRSVIKRYVDSIGFTTIEEASGGRVALEKLRATDYTIVVSAWSMEASEGDGESLLTATRAHAGTARPVPVVMVFDTGDPPQIKRAIDLGAAGYVVIPFAQSALKKALVQGLGEF